VLEAHRRLSSPVVMTSQSLSSPGLPRPASSPSSADGAAGKPPLAPVVVLGHTKKSSSLRGSRLSNLETVAENELDGVTEGIPDPIVEPKADGEVGDDAASVAGSVSSDGEK
jgi:hypothetical protein